jgi:hypothetical protein
MSNPKEYSLEQGMRSRLWVIDVPKHYQEEFISLVMRWYHCSGVEWTISRLKGLKVDLYRRKAGLDPLSHVRKNRRGDLAGCIGGLFRYADKSDKNFRKVVQTLMCYSVFIHSKPTPTQIEKFVTALSADPPIIDRKYGRMFQSIRKNFGERPVKRQKDVSFLLFRGSSEKRKPSLGFSSTPQDRDVLADALSIVDNEMYLHVFRHWDLYGPVFEGISLPEPTHLRLNYLKRKLAHESAPLYGGKVAFIQEAGGKLRSVASPFMGHQLALQHFGDAVYGLIRELPWDCTHDQSRPIRGLQSHLESGQTVHSVDLSAATDYFPLEIQSRCMRAIFGNLSDITLFEEISRSLWKSPIGEVQWKRGQPLGLYPSFAVFTATHGLLLWYLNGCKHNEDFFVVGDDVVITNDHLYHAYIATLQEWGCPYSPDKSISSNQICEFAGKVITPRTVISQYKWREMSNDNFIDICRQLGPRSRILLSKQQKEVFDKIKHVSLPLGLNFSYEGSTLYEMETNSASVFGQAEEKILESLVDLAGVVWKNLHGSPPPSSDDFKSLPSVDTDVLLMKVATFDEKVRDVLRTMLPWFNINIKPGAVSGVPRGLGNTELPLATPDPSRVTNLKRYRQALGL